MEKFRHILSRKPLFFLLAPVTYLLFAAFFKWTIHPTWATLTFVLGGVLGIYFLDAAEEFFALSPSPFRSIIFCFGLAVVSLFVITSSQSAAAAGLVSTLNITLLMWQGKELVETGSAHSWYAMIAGSVNQVVQRWLFVGLVSLFLLNTILFVR